MCVEGFGAYVAAKTFQILKLRERQRELAFLTVSQIYQHG